MTNPTSSDFLKSSNQLARELDQLKAEVEASLLVIARTNPQRSQTIDTLMKSVKTSAEVVRTYGQALGAQADQLTGVTETAALLNSSLEVNEVLERVIDMVIRLTGAERAFIVLKEAGDLTMKVARNWDNETVPRGDATFSTSIVRSAIDNSEPIVTTNAQSDARFSSSQSISTQALRSVLCVPLVSRRETIGVVYADNRVMAGVFGAETVALVRTFAQQAALAIENAKQYEQVKADLNEARQELQVLRIQIDHQQREQQLSDITESDYFKRLEQMAKAQRAARSASE